MELPTTAEVFLIAGYVLFCMGLNGVAFLISAFYRKKLKHYAPYLGFLLSLLFGAVFIGTLLIKDGGSSVSIVRTTSLLGCSMFSALSVTGLYMSMRKAR
ncbi:MAG: hypothetical protein LBI42_05505 [Chitinispirillales bacterium]|jgi:4-hydroxybenzoate polyprenyltransferase|nr:hypothetical protein [Chitinispirillales bacterium]